MSNFFFDRQTLYELQIFSEDGNGSSSIFNLYNHVSTEGGKEKLTNFFRNPLNKLTDIIERQEVIKYFINNLCKVKFPVIQNQMDALEIYFYSKAPVIIASKGIYSVLESLYIRTIKSKSYFSIYRGGVQANLIFLKKIKLLCSQILKEDTPEKLKSVINILYNFLETKEISEAIKQIEQKQNPSFVSLLKLDKLFRDDKKNEYTIFMDSVYELDLYFSLSKAITKNKFTFPSFNDTTNGIKIKELYHPFINKPVTNNFEFEPNKNFVFLTGPNMAGKTTMLKSLGVSLYLAHLGVGVPCKEMNLSIFNGLYTSLNTEDNLSKGYSYFYSEVLRVKNIAKSLHKSNKMLVIFDELFKGTNVKDAFDGSLLVVDGLTNWDSNFFILSSHLLELGRELMKYPMVQFQYFSCSVNNNKPVFTYKLEQGLSDERIGLLIIKNEGIPELLKNNNYKE